MSPEAQQRVHRGCEHVADNVDDEDTYTQTDMQHLHQLKSP
jgi:hypothetical protein